MEKSINKLFSFGACCHYKNRMMICVWIIGQGFLPADFSHSFNLPPSHFEVQICMKLATRGKATEGGGGGRGGEAVQIVSKFGKIFVDIF